MRDCGGRTGDDGYRICRATLLGKARRVSARFPTLYLGIPINCIILGWVNLAMIVILRETLGVSEGTAIAVLVGILLFTAFYTAISGLWGVLVTDLFQFVLKMGMVILLAVFAVNAVGGIDALKLKITELDIATGRDGSRLDFFPPFNSAWMPAVTLCVYLAVTWWASWYPGAEPGGGGYVAQRIFRPRTSVTAYWRRCGLMWPIMLCGLGRGSSRHWQHSCSIRI